MIVLDTYQPIHDHGSLGLHSDGAVAVDVQGDRGFGVTQDLRDHDDGDFVVDHHGSRGMTQIMEADIGQARPFEVNLEVAAQVAGYDGSSDAGGEDQVILLPTLPCPPLCIFISFLLAFEFLERCGLDLDLADACVGFRFLKDHAISIDALGLPADEECGVGPVDILPLQPQELTHAHAGGDGKVVDAVVWGKSGGMKELGDLLFIQYLHFFLFPARQDGTLGGIGFQQALKDGIFESNFENGVNVAHSAASQPALTQLHIEAAQLSIAELIECLLTEGRQDIFVNQAAIFLMGFQADGLFLDFQPILKEFFHGDAWACTSFYLSLIIDPLNRTNFLGVLMDNFSGWREHVSPYPSSLLQVSYVTSVCGCVKSDSWGSDGN